MSCADVIAIDFDSGEDVDSMGTLLCIPDFDVNGLWGIDSVTAAMDAVGSELSLSRLVVLGHSQMPSSVRSAPRSKVSGCKSSVGEGYKWEICQCFVLFLLSD